MTACYPSEVFVFVLRGPGIVAVVLALLLGSGCASKRVYRTAPPATEPAAEVGPGDRPAVSPSPGRPVSPADAVQLGIRVADLAHEQVGKPYRWGGESPGEGFDCSGLVHWSFGCVGIGMPRVVDQQREHGVSITGDRLQPGDLVFFAIGGRETTHVGIYLGGEEFVHAPSSGQPVRVDSLTDSWWRGRWTDSRRVIAAD